MNSLPSFGRFLCAALLLSGLAVTAQPIITDADQVLGPIPAEELPASGTFWFVQQHQPPLPWNPFPQLPVYLFGTNGGHFLVDDSQVDYVALREAQAVDRALVQAELQLGIVQMSSLPELPGGGGGAYDPGVTNLPMAYNYAAGSFYIELVGVTNGTAFVALHGTVEDELYQVFSKETLTNGGWIPEGEPIIGQDSLTLTTFQIVDRTNSLFLRAMSWQDSDGSGMPDWWQLNNFGAMGNDPYGDQDGDGWLNLQEYRSGMDPNVLDLPPAPASVSEVRDLVNQRSIISWEKGSGNVIGYTVARYDPSSDTLSYTPVGLTNVFISSPLLPVADRYSLPEHYVQANYSHTNSTWTRACVDNWMQAPLAYSVQSPSGTNLLYFLHIPPGATTLRFTRFSDIGWTAEAQTDKPVEAFRNVWAPIPGEIITSSSAQYYVQAVWPDGSESDWADVGDPFYPLSHRVPEHLNHNARFLLRAADCRGPLSFYFCHGPYFVVCEDEPAVAFSNHVSAAFWAPGFDPTFYYNGGVDENYLYRNLVYAPDDLSWNGGLETLINSSSGSDIEILVPTTYAAPPDGDPAVFPSVLSPMATQWIAPRPDPTSIGLVVSGTEVSFPMGVVNSFGLKLSSVLVASAGPSLMTLLPGQSFSPTNSCTFYPEFEQPVLQVTNYYFARSQDNGWYDPVPVNGSFDPFAQSAPSIIPVGCNVRFDAYSRQVILNGDPSKRVFVQQYLQGAYELGVSGEITPNQMGFLTHDGSFFATNTGAAALVTEPDTFQDSIQGTNLFYVIGMSTDVNRDGVIETGFGSQDFTTRENRYQFWVNDDNDSGDTEGNDIPGYPALHKKASNGEDNQVNGVRDLIDFFPVFLDLQGFLKSLDLNEIRANYQFVLRHRGDALNFIYTDLTPANFRDYLENTNIAASLAGTYVQRIPPEGVQLLNNFLFQIRDEGKGIILVEARGETWDPLLLEVVNDGNVIAQVTFELAALSVEEMFRHKNLIGETFPSPGYAGGFPDRLTKYEVRGEPPTAQGNFVFVHGYNVNPDEARGAFAEMFKRMYWSGSQAKFYGVTWRGSESQGKLISGLTANYHTNVANAFLTAPHLAKFLATLTNEPTVLAAHSLGNMVCLSAINDWNAPVSKYFMIDAAVPIEAVQGSAPQIDTMIYSDWLGYTNRLFSREWHTLFTDSRGQLTWTNRLANFRNTEVYNFYSSGEEVLRNYTADPPSGLLSAIPLQIKAILQGAKGAYTWVWQEKGKGRATLDAHIASSHGGWGWNKSEDDYYWYINTGDGGMEAVQLAPSLAAQLPSERLRTNAFFDMSYDSQLFGPYGSDYAATNRNRILADAIPALTLPVGANPVPRLSPPLSTAERNFNLNTTDFKNGWPLDRTADSGNWHHSDFRQVAYTFTHNLFDTFVTLGNLQ